MPLGLFCLLCLTHPAGCCWLALKAEWLITFAWIHKLSWNAAAGALWPLATRALLRGVTGSTLAYYKDSKARQTAPLFSTRSEQLSEWLALQVIFSCDGQGLLLCVSLQGHRCELSIGVGSSIRKWDSIAMLQPKCGYHLQSLYFISTFQKIDINGMKWMNLAMSLFICVEGEKRHFSRLNPKGYIKMYFSVVNWWIINGPHWKKKSYLTSGHYQSHYLKSCQVSW